MSSSSVDTVNNFETNAGAFRSGRPRADRTVPPGAAQAKWKPRVMSVEDVLQWAFRDELPKDRGLGGSFVPGMPMAPMWRNAALGTPVDNWSREPGLPTCMGPPAPDALKVEASVQALEAFADQAIDDVPDLMGDFGELGVDETRAIRRALCMMPAIVARCAKLRCRPMWTRNIYPGPMRAPNGRTIVVRSEPVFSKTITGEEVEHEVLAQVEARAKGEYPFGSHSPLQYDPSPQSVAEERAEYLVWWGALEMIARDLDGKLETITVLPSLAPQRPWNEHDELGPAPRLLADITGRGFRKEQSAAAEAHRMLGLRRPPSARRATRRGGRPAVAAPRSMPALRSKQTACGSV